MIHPDQADRQFESFQGITGEIVVTKLSELTG
jgi:hypothetical protein